MATIKQQIQEIREFFDTVRRGTPLVKDAIKTLNTTFDSFLGKGTGFEIYASQITSAFNLIKTSSNATGIEIEKTAQKIQRVMESANNPRSRLKILGGEYSSYPSGRIKPSGIADLVKESGLENFSVSENLTRRLDRLRVGQAFTTQPGIAEGSIKTLLNRVKGSQRIEIQELSKVMGPEGVFSSAGLSQEKALKSIIPALDLVINGYKNLNVTGQEAAASQKLLNQQLAAYKSIISQPGGMESLRNAQLRAGKPQTNEIGLKEYFERDFGAGGEAVLKKVESYANRYGYAINNIKSINKEASTGMSRITFGKDVAIMEGGTEIGRITEKVGLHIDRLGNVMKDTQGRFRSFGSSVMRDTAEFLKWSIAATVVYAPLQAVNKLMVEMTENQSKLADLQIITGQTSEDVYSAFQNIADVATLTGESLGGVIDGYKAAYVAAGSITNQYERAATASTLLSDSLLLTRLSGLTQAESMDILSAALKQVGGQLGENDNKLLSGINLIDKWVAVSKIANVNVQTLATSFAIVGSAAEDVGLGIDQLNGVIAAVAEVSNLSAQETGNMVRAFISGYQSDEAIKELGKFGIAVTDTEGKVRDYMTVMTEIRALSDAGIISPEQAAKIADTLGGGARRGAQYSSFLRNLDKVQQIATISANAQANAYDALGIKMDTLKGSTSKLGVSFSTLAQALGNEGGVLDSASGILDLATKLVNIFTLLTTYVGGVTPVFLTLAGAMGFFNTQSATSAKFMDKISKYGYALGSKGSKAFGYGARDFDMVATPEEISRAQPTKVIPGTDIAVMTGMEKAADKAGLKMANVFTRSIKYLPAVAMGGVAAVGNIKEGQFGGAALDIGLAVAGQKLAGPIGAMVGVSIAEAFVNAATSDPDLTKGMTDAYVSALQKSMEQLPETEAKKSKTELAKEAEQNLKDVALGGGISGQLSSWSVGLLSSVWGDVLKQSTGGLTKEQVGTALLYNKAMETEEGRRAWDAYSEAVRESLTEGIDDVETATQHISNLMSKDVTATRERFGGLDQAFVVEKQSELADKMRFGEISATDYKATKENLQTITTQIQQIWSAAGAKFATISNIEDLNEAYSALGDTIFELSEPERLNVIQMVGEIADLKNQSDAVDELNAKIEELGSILAGTRQGQLMQKVELPNIVDVPKLNEKQIDALMVEAQSATRAFYESMVAEPWMADKFIADLPEIAVEVAGEAGKAAGETFYKKFKDVDTNILDDVMEAAQKAGKIPIQNLNIQDMTDITTGELMGNIMPNYQVILKAMQTAFGEENVPTEQTGVILKDGMQMLNVNMLAFRLAQQRTNELLEDQLDGIYNLPEGMNLWVPSAAAEMSAKTLAAGGGGGGYMTPEQWLEMFKNVQALFVKEETATGAQEVGATSEEIQAELDKADAYNQQIMKISPAKTGMDFWKDFLGLTEDTVGPRRDDTESPLINNLNKVLYPESPAPITMWTPLTNAFDAFITSLQPLVDVFKGGNNTQPVSKSDITLNATNNINIDGYRLATIVKRMIARDLTSYGGNRTISAFVK